VCLPEHRRPGHTVEKSLEATLVGRRLTALRVELLRRVDQALTEVRVLEESSAGGRAIVHDVREQWMNPVVDLETNGSRRGGTDGHPAGE